MPRLPYSRPMLVLIAVSFAFTAFGVFLAIRTGASLLPAVFFGFCLAIGLISPWLERRARRGMRNETVEFDDTAIRRRLPNGAVESITWDELAAIDIMTTDGGPYTEDVFWLLMSGDQSRGCAVGGGAGGFTELLPRLQALPGFDNGEVIKAMGSTGNARFVVWRR
jgi:hypothetical protein